MKGDQSKAYQTNKLHPTILKANDNRLHIALGVVAEKAEILLVTEIPKR